MQLPAQLEVFPDFAPTFPMQDLRLWQRLSSTSPVEAVNISTAASGVFETFTKTSQSF